MIIYVVSITLKGETYIQKAFANLKEAKEFLTQEKNFFDCEGNIHIHECSFYKNGEYFSEIFL